MNNAGRGVRFGALLLLTGIFPCPDAPAQSKPLIILYQSREYHDLGREVERRLAGGARPDTTLLAYSCIAYAGTRNYARLDECLPKLQRSINAGDVKVITDNWLLGASFEVQPLPALLVSQKEFELGNHEGSIARAKEALGVVPRMTQTEATLLSPTTYRMMALSQLAMAAAASGRKEEARRYVQDLEAVPLSFIAISKTSQDKKANLARAYMALGEYAKALANLEEGLARGITGLVGEELNVQFDLPRLVMRGKALNEVGRLAEAKVVLDQLLSRKVLANVAELYWIVLVERARIAEAEGDLDMAVRLLREAVELIERQRSTINTEASKIGFVGSKQNAYRDLIRLLMAQGQVSSAFDYVERSKARALVDMLARKKDFAVSGGDAERVRELLARADSAEASMWTAEPGEAATARRSAASQARQDLAAAAPELTSLVTVSALGAGAVQQALAADETLLEYYYSDTDLFAFIVTREAVSGVRLDATSLDRDVQAFRKAVQTPSSQGWSEASIGLHRRLIAPLQDRLRTENLIIVPHGSLHYLPFNALSDGAGFLIERHAVRILPAATVLKFLAASRPERPGTLLAFGNPDLGNARYDLAFAQTEAESITKAFPNSRALLRKEASKTAFRKYASDFRMLHVASHGEFDADRPLASSLLLSPDGADNGRLTVGELYSMRVEAELVTLSACETGLGKVANGDDVVGLTRGFLYAGASTIVASLWQVEDRSTGELMTSFYQALAKGSGKREALRAAQAEFLRKQPHPFFWAAFQLTGAQ